MNAAAARLQTTRFQDIQLSSQLFDVSYGGALQLATVAIQGVDVLNQQLVGTLSDDGCVLLHHRANTECMYIAISCGGFSANDVSDVS